MKQLAIDIETYSSVSLLSSGVYSYAESPDFEILLFGYAFDDDPVQVVDFAQEEKLPADVYQALTAPDVIKTAYNANFERTCLAAWFNKPMPPEQWYCTAVLARELGLPSSLEDVGAAIGLPQDQQKLKTGRALIRFFSLPCKPTKANGQRCRNLPSYDLDRWKLYIEYNRQDVVTERAIRKKLSRYAVADSEHDLWCLDQKINDRGVRVDLAFAKAATQLDEQSKDALLWRARMISGIENPKSQVQVKHWIENMTGVTVESLEKKQIPALRESINSPEVLEFLDLRSQLSKTSTEKYKAMITTACADSRIRGLTQFYGAGRTGRWAGRLVQMQNLPQNHLEDLDDARQLVKNGGAEFVYDNIPDTLSQLIRTAFIPADGCKFVVSDFSAIEARVIAWLADEHWRMSVFRTHGKIYEASAEKMFNLPEGSVHKGDPLRQKGKIAELALGYGGSSGALIAMGALEMGLKEEELKPLVTAWRSANKHICQLWWDVDDAVKRVLCGQGTEVLPRGIRIRKDGSLLRIQLPSGRELSYVQPVFHPGAGAFGKDEITYLGIDQKTGNWGTISTYGPKLVENIVQATSRDCLAEAIRRLEAQDIHVVFHVHDEVICEVPKSGISASDLSAIMSRPIAWAPGLPLRADAYECEYYRKD